METRSGLDGKGAQEGRLLPVDGQQQPLVLLLVEVKREGGGGGGPPYRACVTWTANLPNLHFPPLRGRIK